MIAQNDNTRLTFTDALASFTITFPTFEADSIDVYVVDSAGAETALVKDTHYTLSNLNVNGQDATIALIAASGAAIDGTNDLLDGSNNLNNSVFSLVVEHDAEAFQPGYFRNLGANTVITLEQVLDRLTMAIKSINRDLADVVSDLADAVADIATNAADILTNTTNIATNVTNISALDDEVYSKSQTLSNNTTSSITSTAINETEYDSAIMSYVAKRGGSVQVGKVVMINESPFAAYQVEKVGDVGLSFSADDTAGVGTIQYTTTNTGSDVDFRYKYDRLDL